MHIYIYMCTSVCAYKKLPLALALNFLLLYLFNLFASRILVDIIGP